MTHSQDIATAARGQIGGQGLGVVSQQDSRDVTAQSFGSFDQFERSGEYLAFLLKGDHHSFHRKTLSIIALNISSIRLSI